MKQVTISILLIILLLHGCSFKHFLIPDPSITKPATELSNKPEDSEGTHKINKKTSTCWKDLFSHEYIEGQSPVLGLSLSGGGVRSASFCMGALKGLSDNRILNKIDVISTVSGGGYIGYWLFDILTDYEMMRKRNKQYEHSNDRSFLFDDLFKDCFPDDWEGYEKYHSLNKCSENGRSNYKNYQYQVAQSGEYLLYQFKGGTIEKKAIRMWELIEKMFLQILTAVPHHISNSLFDWGCNFTAGRRSYQNGIERAYGFIPEYVDFKTGKTQFKNALDYKILGRPNFKTDKELEFFELKEATEYSRSKCSKKDRDQEECYRMPLWIINMTTGLPRRFSDDYKKEINLFENVFSITQFGYGSGEYGFVKETFKQMTVPQAVSVSGAAVDSQQNTMGEYNRWISLLLHMVNGNIGYSIDNYNPDRHSIALHRTLPWPLYYFHGYSLDEKATEIYLSDGGHSENLGAYSLIIRGVPNIIVIDAEYDPRGEFDALFKLRLKLKKNHDLTLRLFDEFGHEKKFEELTNECPYCMKNPIFKLKVTGFDDNYIINNGKKQNYIDIIYVKSSIDEERMSEMFCHDGINSRYYPCTTYHIYKTINLNEHKPCSELCKEKISVFPHHSTFTTAVKTEQPYYLAYRDLGAYLTKRIVTIDGRLEILPFPIVGDKNH